MRSKHLDGRYCSQARRPVSVRREIGRSVVRKVSRRLKLLRRRNRDRGTDWADVYRSERGPAIAGRMTRTLRRAQCIERR